MPLLQTSGCPANRSGPFAPASYRSAAVEAISIKFIETCGTARPSSHTRLPACTSSINGQNCAPSLESQTKRHNRFCNGDTISLVLPECCRTSMTLGIMTVFARAAWIWILFITCDRARWELSSIRYAPLFGLSAYPSQTCTLRYRHRSPACSSQMSSSNFGSMNLPVESGTATDFAALVTSPEFLAKRVMASENPATANGGFSRQKCRLHTRIPWPLAGTTNWRSGYLVD